MAAVDVIVDWLVSLWRRPGARRNFPWIFLPISVAGSIVKALGLLPQSYFSDSRNALNLYFVKVSWGWTLLLLTPFILLSNFSFNRSVPYLARRLTSLAVATAVWYLCTQMFVHCEDWTGGCVETGGGGGAQVVRREFTTRVACRRAGLLWEGGWEISGHAFILAYAALFIVEETASMASLKRDGLSALPRTVLKLLYVALNLLVLVWVWMFVCTSVYFHDFVDKLLGTAIGLAGWYLTYRVWYRRALSPGLPPEVYPTEDKQHA